MNIYEKITEAKEMLLNLNIKKSGTNRFAGYSYYELADFTPHIIKICKELKLFTSISFDKELATLTIVNAEKPDEVLKYTSPMEELELKGCNKIQALGGTETYSRRYLYMTAFDIIENDMFDAVVNEDENKKKIDKVKVDALKMAIENNKISSEDVSTVLAKYNYKKIENITLKDFGNVVNEFRKLKGGE